jgi:hypothetical protein
VETFSLKGGEKLRPQANTDIRATGRSHSHCRQVYVAYSFPGGVVSFCDGLPTRKTTYQVDEHIESAEARDYGLNCVARCGRFGEIEGQRSEIGSWKGLLGNVSGRAYNGCAGL